jgi:hypothetical protein
MQTAISISLLFFSLNSFAETKDINVMSPERRAFYIKTLPKFENPKINLELLGNNVFFYDEETILPAYQDSVPPFVGVQSNNSSIAAGRTNIFANGKFRFPFGKTAGLHESHLTDHFNMIVLPKNGDKIYPIIYFTKPASFNGEMGTRYDWLFPVGTTIYEVISHISPIDQKYYVFEVRTLRRKINGWTPNIYRPFPEAKDLANAIEKLYPEWRKNDQLVKVMDYVKDYSKLEKEALPESVFFKGEGYVDELPIIDEKIVANLLKSTPFQSVLGTSWKDNEGKVSFAPKVNQDFSIFPRGNKLHALEVSSKTCTQCHQETGRPMATMFHEDSLYGEIWGSDRIFSFHPFTHGSVYQGVQEGDPRQFRSEFLSSGLFEAYNPEKHPESIYKQLPYGFTHVNPYR